MARALVLLAAALVAVPAAAQDAGALRGRHAALRAELADNPFGRPLHVQSRADGGRHMGDVHATVAHPFQAVVQALSRPQHWCDILLLQVNVKRCEAGPGVRALITRKPRDAVEDAHQVDFRFEVVAAREDYLYVALKSPSGPVGTRDYDITLQAAPLDAERTIVHMSYAYTLGFAARIAMDAYLNTSGRDKVGFSIVGRQPDGRPQYVDGVRGVVERGAMRYYLAIESFLEAPGRLEARLRDWYAAIERYPQLREEVGREEYVQMKSRPSAPSS